MILMLIGLVGLLVFLFIMFYKLLFVKYYVEDHMNKLPVEFWLIVFFTILMIIGYCLK